MGHALDHVAYNWAKCLPSRHDGRNWTKEERELYDKTYDALRVRRETYEHP
jgi:hypothetical protein